MGKLNTKNIEAFMENVEKTRTCWLWNKCTNQGGYGQWRVNYKHHLAHRIAYELFIGEIPDGLKVCHTCDVPNCVNPDHLFLGTQQDNMRDMVNKGRQNNTIGENNGQSKLTEEEVQKIRQLYQKGWKQRELADKFNVSKATIGFIVREEHWKHI